MSLMIRTDLASQIDLDNGSKYCAYDNYGSIEGLIGVQEKSKASILTFNETKNADFFVKTISSQFSKELNAKLHSLSTTGEERLVMLKKEADTFFFSPFQFLITKWKGNSSSSSGFIHRTYEETSSPSNKTIPKPMKLVQPVDSPSSKSSLTPRSTTKKFAFFSNQTASATQTESSHERQRSPTSAIEPSISREFELPSSNGVNHNPNGIKQQKSVAMEFELRHSPVASLANGKVAHDTLELKKAADLPKVKKRKRTKTNRSNGAEHSSRELRSKFNKPKKNFDETTKKGFKVTTRFTNYY